MKKLVVAVLFVSSMMTAQDIDVVKGNFDFLKDQKEINVEFDYSKMTLMKEKKTEAQYIEDRTKELNEKTKGVGNIWMKKWNASKELIWSPKFLELMNVVFVKDKKETSFQEGLIAAKYTLIVETVWIYPGWDAMVMKQPAKVSTLLKFVETNDKSNVLLEISSQEAPGDQYGSNFSNESRIGEGFAKTAKSLAKMVLKKAYK
ncbi:hypothetical protein E0I61_03060 [Flavobacterium ranwuense]|uniref:DUF4468 domain-containing protein n=1 Tax=Flavobacterium ranwuense TaxID=2541725 RepID=A0ABY2DVF1_9FLAO|nr:hypothetical protein [Flavobacterium ranwuense]TDE31698.1 hypothetical protein E0I61_03060 [Flavobacterium ranwuense]